MVSTISMMIFVASFSGLLTDSGLGLKFEVPNKEREKDADYWFSLGKEEIDEALNRPIQNDVAKNVIIFVGDGMGITVTTAGRIYKGQLQEHSGEEESLVWEKFPNLALLKTYNLNKQVPDSAGTGTAYFGGVKANYYTLGVNGKVQKGDCQASLDENNHVSSILKWFQEDGKDTGFITTTRVTHATPAALYAHSADRDWECDKAIKDANESSERCKDIARQLVEDLPGRDINVVFAGGRRQMGATLEGDDKDSSCLRNDSRNLVEEWLKDKEEKGMRTQYITNTQELREMDGKEVDYVMGLFAGGHLPYSYKRDESSEGVPSLKELTEVAIKRLQRNEKGFFLMVEGGRIDHALHDSKPRNAFGELLAFEEAVEVALQLTQSNETLIIVSADHSHVMTINGYPERGNDILGITESAQVTDNLPYTTLMFTNGPGANFTYVDSKVIRSNLTGVDTRDHDFMSQSAVPTKVGEETHGGEDVAAYAVGPMSHLFHRVHEQTYIAHVMGYAACVGPFKERCSSITSNADNTGTGNAKPLDSIRLRRDLIHKNLLKFPMIN